MAKTPFKMGKSYPCLDDRYQSSGTAKGHYFHQDLHVAKRIFEEKPDKHLDVGSRVDGFIAHVASFRKITILDIRPLTGKIPNVSFSQCNIMGDLAPALVESADSLSSLHALEHFGLGRYGDPVNYDGYLDGFNNLYRILRPGGKLYLSVPIGPMRIEFDAHRVFDMVFLLKLVSDRFEVDAFSYVDDKGDFYPDAGIERVGVECNYNCTFGCGIFELTKKVLQSSGNNS
ncbi:MAG: DUF268 domain-containing protein [Sedimenticola sp.]